MKRLLILLLALLLSACASESRAPVYNRDAASAEAAQPGYYTVRKGDTLYSIALDNGQSYRDVAAWNKLDNPNVIKVGQQLRVAPPGQTAPSGQPVTQASDEGVQPISNNDVQPVAAAAAPAAASPPATSPAAESSTFKQSPKGGEQPYSAAAWSQAQAAQQKAAASPASSGATPGPAPATAAPSEAAATAAAGAAVSDWVWPAAGKISAPFSENGNKGIDIPGKIGQPVYAAANGTVTLVSDAIRGYGNLIVIKHSATLLSVYAHNSKVLVHEKQTVTKGQKIAEIGASGTDTPMLHFEIRRMGKPVDPLKFLPPR